MQKLINIQELSRMTGFTVGTLYQFCSQKRLPFLRFSRRCIRFDVNEIMEWIVKHRVEPQAGLRPINQRKRP